MTNYSTVGKETERMVSRFLRESGAYPKAERLVRTGWNTGARVSDDEGDIRNTGPVCFQVKSLRPESRAERMVGTWIGEVGKQAETVGALLPVLVVRRWTIRDVSKWWAFTSLTDLLDMIGSYGQPPTGPPGIVVRTTVKDLIDLLDFYDLTERNAE